MCRIRSLTISGFLALFFLFLSQPVSAQSIAPSLESCFQYYDYGNIRAQLSPEKSSYSPGEPVKIWGSVVNNNTFPVVDTVLYAHVRRINESSYQQNGHYLVDRLTLEEGLNFIPGESKNIEFNLPDTDDYANGDYQIQYFIFSKYGFHYGGRPFLEEDHAGVSNFSIRNGDDPEVYFDINSLTVNGTPHDLREQIAEYSPGEMALTVGLHDSRPVKSAIPVLMKLYSFEDTFESKLVTESSHTIPSGRQTFPLTITPPAAGAYVLVLEIPSPQKSLFKYRFAVTGDTESTLRMNDLGVSDFPFTAQSRAWVCFHSPTLTNSRQTTVTLSVLDDNQKVVDAVSISDAMSSDVAAISIPLEKLQTPDDFSIEATFADSGGEETVSIHYDCGTFQTAVRLLSLRYDPRKPFILSVDAKNSCGNTVQDSILDAVRIRSGDALVMEKDNYAVSSGSITLTGFAPGAYSAEVRMGEDRQTLDFTIPDSAGRTSRTMMIVIVTAILIVVTVLSVWLFKRKRRP